MTASPSAAGLQLIFAALTASLGLAIAVPATAQSSWIDEAKVGVLAHDVGIFGDGTEGGADIVGEVLFKSPSFLDLIGSPRPTLGVSVNTNGNTDYVYADLTWSATLLEPGLQPQDGVYAGFFFGGAVHDGELDHRVDDNKPLGTRALFHLGVLAGYQINPLNSIEFYFAHLSNAGLGKHNAGLNNIGARTGFKF
jgi:lipid A 3-O-deacylase